MERNTIFSDVIIVESGIILTELLNQKSVGNVTVLFCSKVQQNFHRLVQLMTQSQLLRS